MKRLLLSVFILGAIALIGQQVDWVKQVKFAPDIQQGNNGTDVLVNSISGGNAIFSHHLTVEGVTSTGATGTGKFVFNINPDIPNIATLSNFTLVQTPATPFTSFFSGAVTNTLVLNAGKVGVLNSSPVGLLTVGSGASAFSVNTSDVGSGAWIRNDGSNTVISTNVGDIFFGFGGNTSKSIRIGNGNPGVVNVTGNAPAHSLDVNASGQVSVSTTAFASLGGVPAAGTMIYCTNCTTAATCASGGSGHLAVSNGTNWTCQ